MSRCNEISNDFDDAWMKVKESMDDDDSNAFYQAYIEKIKDVIDRLNISSESFENDSSELLSKLQEIREKTNLLD